MNTLINDKVAGVTAQEKKKKKVEKKSKKKPHIPLRKYTLGGRIATVLFIIEVLIVAVSVVWSFHKKGNAGTEVGLMAAVALLMSVSGFFIGILSFKDDMRFLTYSWIGTITNLIVFLGISMLFLIYV